MPFMQLLMSSYDGLVNIFQRIEIVLSKLVAERSESLFNTFPFLFPVHIYPRQIEVIRFSYMQTYATIYSEFSDLFTHETSS